MKQEVQIPAGKKIININELKKMGLSYYKINQAVEAGKLTKLNKSNYENCEFSGEVSDFVYVYAYAPTGVICLMSAAVYYGLSNYWPDSIDVAVPKKKNITTLPDWPTLSLYYFERDRYETGILELRTGEHKFKIYDIEKTVVDIIYYRNKIGIEETKEILTKYLKREDRNINKLYRYAELLKCNDILKTYLEVLI
ncbi:type IV toxin-antitoxin system AbiEi family antitoxin [uncultured Acetobacterium sp.]|uniref:type IV toxin-antitoxin system AbiEi family antitoxin domain-containing protein n=1 Tax=uncultured Acetobacterium sp. TaxID=217139 RepID=UPI0025D4EB0C|nr:type IV toxin-antitoxin system AbiEi family antitoxin [uncultured Acetobacterium sp.]